MPSWKIHNKWAARMGLSLSEDDLNNVNRLIDNPKSHKGFQNFCDKEPEAHIFRKSTQTAMHVGQFIGHDMARSKPYAKDVQIQFLSIYGAEFERAFYLHNLLDYFVWWLNPELKQAGFSTEEALEDKHIAKKIGPPDDLVVREIVDFMRKNLTEIEADCREWIAECHQSHHRAENCVKP